MQDNRRKLGCGYTCAAKGVDHERFVVVLKAGCVIDGNLESCACLKEDHENCNRTEKRCITNKNKIEKRPKLNKY